jgi:DNA-nicking Smr family endonuclease
VGFDEILRDWEAGRARRAAEGERRAAARRDPAARSMEEWLERHPPQAQPGRDDGDGSSPAERAAALRRLAPQATLDLHGMTAEEAAPALERFVSAARKAGLRKVLVIHGKGHHSQGEPVLQRLVREYLERSRHTGAFGAADRTMGGSGAVWVVLRTP